MPYRIRRALRAVAARAAGRRLCRGTALVVSWLIVVAGSSTAGAVALTGPAGALGSSRPVHDTRPLAAVGAVFQGRATSSSSGDHFCSAAVVDSPAGDLIVTAAHCVGDGAGDLYFAPGWHDGRAPYGVWALARVTLDPRWTGRQDPDLDVAFATLRPLAGRSVQDVVGGYALGTGRLPAGAVRVTGYPGGADAPLTCVNRISADTATQLRIACAGYRGGTSGSPWVAADRTVVGVIGGYEQGGDTPDVSYSAYFGADIAALYRQALSRG